MICIYCRQEIRDDSKFCDKCGRKIPRCPACGRASTKKIHFCAYDGTPIPEDIFGSVPEQGRYLEPARLKSATGSAGEPEKSNKIIYALLIGIVVVLILAIVGVAAYFLLGDFMKEVSADEEIAAESENIEEKGEDEETDEIPIPEEESSPEKSQEEDTQKEPEITYEHTYEVIAADMSWQAAKAACEDRGGYLATITSEDEYNEICSLAEESGLTYLWLGACINSEDDEWSNDSWLTGEAWTYDNWYPGEPSKQDIDGIEEFCLCLWNVKYDGQDIGWTFNDQRNNLVEEVPSVAGKVGYICEYEVESN